MLHLLGNQTMTAYDGLQAIEFAERFRPDIVLMDIGLPKLSVSTRQDNFGSYDWGKDIRIIALTAGDRKTIGCSPKGPDAMGIWSNQSTLMIFVAQLTWPSN